MVNLKALVEVLGKLIFFSKLTFLASWLFLQVLNWIAPAYQEVSVNNVNVNPENERNLPER
jgi:hypothetical protein